MKLGLLILVFLVPLVCACGQKQQPEPAAAIAPIAVEPRLLPLAGPAAAPEAEISALFWYGDRLVLVPQHPERYAAGGDTLGFFVLDRADIVATIDHERREPLRPRPGRLVAPRLLDSVPGWDGLEAAAVLGDTVFLAVEAKVDGRMAGYLLRGVLDPVAEPLTLTIDTDLIAPVPITTQLPNMSQEALVLTPDRVAVVFEVNGRRVNPGAHVAVFDHDLDYRGNVPMVHLEYRVTDACRGAAPDSTFWVLNYYFPPEGPLLQPPDIPPGPVEQIVQLRFDGERLVRGLCPPLDLRRDPDLPARNWEAMVLLPGRGFLLMTDRYPTTLLAFVPFPDEAAGYRGDTAP